MAKNENVCFTLHTIPNSFGLIFSMILHNLWTISVTCFSQIPYKSTIVLDNYIFTSLHIHAYTSFQRKWWRVFLSRLFLIFMFSEHAIYATTLLPLLFTCVNLVQLIGRILTSIQCPWIQGIPSGRNRAEPLSNSSLQVAFGVLLLQHHLQESSTASA